MDVVIDHLVEQVYVLRAGRKAEIRGRGWVWKRIIITDWTTMGAKPLFELILLNDEALLNIIVLLAVELESLKDSGLSVPHEASNAPKRLPQRWSYSRRPLGLNWSLALGSSYL